MRKLDRTDIGILNALQENARITNADLARSVNLSPTPCFNRVKAMEELGLIREQVTLLDADLLGLHVNVFIHVSLEKQVEEALQHFEEAISDRPEVMECYLMAGDPDFRVRFTVADRIPVGELGRLVEDEDELVRETARERLARERGT